jgi:2-oxoglutarate ferredoxin oxidoreductase subunit gamma
VKDLDMLVVLSQDAYTRFTPALKKGGLLVTEADLVTPQPPVPDVRHYVVPATRLAEEIGRKIVLNIITVGFFGAVSQLMPQEALEKAVRQSVPPGTLDLNLKAFRCGFDAGKAALGKVNAAV